MWRSLGLATNRIDYDRNINKCQSCWHPLHKLAIRKDPDWSIVTWIILEK